jgi:predicted transcriptional regulator
MMSKVKISVYLDPSQLKLINEIADRLKQKRALVLREAVNCYLTLYVRSKRSGEDEMV